MASFHINGLDELENLFEQLAKMPDSVKENILSAQEKVIIKAQKKRAPKRTGKMSGSIKGGPVKITYDGARKDIYPHGVHHVSNKSHYRKKGGGARARTVTNSEVGFIHEFGAPGKNIPAKSWMRTANEECAAETTEAAQQELDKWIDSL